MEEISDGLGDLERFFRHGEHRLIHKLPHYFPIYERHLQRFRDRPVTMLEIGVNHGGSLQMWKDYLGPRAQIWGVDIDERCKGFEEGTNNRPNRRSGRPRLPSQPRV